jgi:hypothetical protein
MEVGQIIMVVFSTILLIMVIYLTNKEKQLKMH